MHVLFMLDIQSSRHIIIILADIVWKNFCTMNKTGDAYLFQTFFGPDSSV